MNFTPEFEKPKDDRREYASVTKYMATDLITFSPNQEIEKAMEIMLEKRISGAPVLDEKHNLVGLLSEKDCLRVIIESSYDNYPVSGKVSDYMSRNVMTISADKDVLDAATMFLNSHFRRYPIVRDGKLVGQVSRRDIMKAAQEIKSTDW